MTDVLLIIGCVEFCVMAPLQAYKLMSVSKSFYKQFKAVVDCFENYGTPFFSEKESIFLSTCRNITQDQLSFFIHVLLQYVRTSEDDIYPSIIKRLADTTFYIVTRNSFFATVPVFRLPVYRVRYIHRPRNWIYGTAFIFYGSAATGKTHIIDLIKNSYSPSRRWVLLMRHRRGRAARQREFVNRSLIHNFVCFDGFDVEAVQFSIGQLCDYPHINFAISLHNESEVCAIVETVLCTKRIFVISSHRTMEFG